MTILTLFKRICIIEGIKFKTYKKILKDNSIDKQTKNIYFVDRFGAVSVSKSY